MRYDNIYKMTKLIYIVFDNFFFLSSHLIILEIVNSNPIVGFIYDLKLHSLFFKSKLDSTIQNSILIINKTHIKFLLYQIIAYNL